MSDLFINLNAYVKKHKPILKIADTSFTVLIDTGATVPVWTSGLDSLITTFPDVQPMNDIAAILNGFGGISKLSEMSKEEKRKLIKRVYKIPVLQVAGANKDICTFYDIPVVESAVDYGYNLILCADFVNNQQVTFNLPFNFIYSEYSDFKCKEIRYNENPRYLDYVEVMPITPADDIKVIERCIANYSAYVGDASMEETLNKMKRIIPSHYKDSYEDTIRYWPTYRQTLSDFNSKYMEFQTIERKE